MSYQPPARYPEEGQWCRRYRHEGGLCEGWFCHCARRVQQGATPETAWAIAVSNVLIQIVRRAHRRTQKAKQDTDDTKQASNEAYQRAEKVKQDAEKAYERAKEEMMWPSGGRAAGVILGGPVSAATL